MFLHADPSQIQIVGNTMTGANRQRHLLQQQSGGEGANLQIQIRPTPDQASSCSQIKENKLRSIVHHHL